MTFKIPGPKAAALGPYKPRCEAWVEAWLAGDKATCEQVFGAIESDPPSPQRDEALAYLRKKQKEGIKSKPVTPSASRTETAPVKKTPIDTMRLAVNLLTISRRPFAEALLEAIKADKMTEAVLIELKAVIESAITALKRQNEFRDLYKIPDHVK
ncbi:MAG: hypothetical protein N2652_12405 [Kiritimatiellae bacterium]|nr:hypothetical protein [Kiritimatiellia bacterium]